ncbi:UNVERIFIED_CONTAM: hypothetical protein FKN15_055039 [Acipenser sinensis]
MGPYRKKKIKFLTPTEPEIHPVKNVQKLAHPVKALARVQDALYSLDIASSNPGYSTADRGRELPGGGTQLAERRLGGGRVRSARVSSAHRAPATPVVWLGVCGLACKLPRAVLSSDAVALRRLHGLMPLCEGPQVVASLVFVGSPQRRWPLSFPSFFPVRKPLRMSGNHRDGAPLGISLFCLPGASAHTTAAMLAPGINHSAASPAHQHDNRLD